MERKTGGTSARKNCMRSTDITQNSNSSREVVVEEAIAETQDNGNFVQVSTTNSQGTAGIRLSPRTVT